MGLVKAGTVSSAQSVSAQTREDNRAGKSPRCSALNKRLRRCLFLPVFGSPQGNAIIRTEQVRQQAQSFLSSHGLSEQGVPRSPGHVGRCRGRDLARGNCRFGHKAGTEMWVTWGQPGISSTQAVPSPVPAHTRCQHSCAARKSGREMCGVLYRSSRQEGKCSKEKLSRCWARL